MNQKITLIFGALLLMSVMSTSAQTTLSLEEAVNYAVQNNLQIQQAAVTVRGAELTLQQSQFARLPSANASTAAGYQFGRNIDPTTNDFINQRTAFNTYSLQANALLYDGSRLTNQIKQSRLDVQAARLDTRSTQNTIALSVANAYLTVLLSQEQLANARQRLELSRQQLRQTERLIEAGSLPVNDRLDLDAQVALDEQAIIEAENLVEVNYLTLKQLMQLDPAQDIRVVVPDVEVAEAAMTRSFELAQVYQSALQTQPEIEAADLRIESARLGENIARSGMLPTLSVFAGLNTNYSSSFLDFNNPNEDNVKIVANPPQTVLVNGSEVLITTFREEGVVFPRRPFIDQLKDNFGQNVGLNLSIPIYNNHTNRIGMERARLEALSSELESRRLRDQLRANVQRSITDYRAARESYVAAQRSVEAAEAAYSNADKRYQLGGINTLDFTTAANNLDQARNQLSRAKYQLIFNLKVVEFYLGQQLELD